jgi:DNA ligase (NAD+)
VDYLPKFSSYSPDELQSLEDIGPKVAGSIYQFFHNKDNLHMLEKLERMGLSLRNDRASFKTTGNLDGQTFLFTGSLQKLKRTEAEEQVEKNGGKILSGVSSKLNYLVVGEDAGSKLEKAKKIPSIKILSEQEFLHFINGQ